MTFFKIKEKPDSLKALSIEAHKRAKCLAFSKRLFPSYSFAFKASIVPINQNYPQHK